MHILLQNELHYETEEEALTVIHVRQPIYFEEPLKIKINIDDISKY